jgi:predicted GIY-YIG superfamily endonuclease
MSAKGLWAAIIAWSCFHPVLAEEKPPDLSQVVAQAFRDVHDGWSADEVVVNDTLNAAFLDRCHNVLPTVSDRDFNWTLLNLRKAGKLDIKATKRATERHDEYLHAAEIAARFLYDKYGETIDRVLCDPQRRREFDAVAQAAAPGVSAYGLRKAALGLRKARRLRPELVARVADWSKEIITRPASEIAKEPSLVPTKPGVYIFRDASGYLYIGESVNLRTRLQKHLDQSDRQSLASYFTAQGIGEVTVELHAFAADSNARLESMRRAYESELIRSRKPRFNITP